MAGMTMEDIRRYESAMHDETNKLVGAATESDSSSAAAATAAAGDANDDEAPNTPSNTPTEKSAPFQFPDVENAAS